MRAIARQLIANRPLAALTVANGLSSAGDWLYLTMLPLLVYRETSDPILVGLVGAGRLLPWLLLSIPAGALVDRAPGPRLLVVTEASRAVLMLLMAGLVAVDGPLLLILLGALAAVVAGTIAMPAQGRLFPVVAGSDEALQAANVARAMLDNVACVVGPAVAGLLVYLDQIELGLVLNGISFVVVLAAVASLAPGAQASGSASDREESVEPGGESILAIARGASARLTVDAAISFAAGALWVLPVLLASQVLLVGDGAIGLLGIGGGIGGVVGGLVAARYIDSRRRRGMAIALASVAAGIAALPIGSSVWVTLVAMTAASGALVTVDTLNMTELQLTTPRDRLGRTLGILHTSAAAFVMAGSAVPGIVMASLGVEAACLCTAAVVGGVGLVGVVEPRLRLVRGRALRLLSVSLFRC